METATATEKGILYRGSEFVKRESCPSAPLTEKINTFQICAEDAAEPDQMVVKIHRILTGEEFKDYSVNYFDYMWKIKYILGSQFCEIYLYLCKNAQGYQLNYRKVAGDYEPFYLFVCKLIELVGVEKKFPPPPMYRSISDSSPLDEQECNNILKLFNQPYLESKREALQIFIDKHPPLTPSTIESILQIIENDVVWEYTMDYLLIFLEEYQITLSNKLKEKFEKYQLKYGKLIKTILVASDKIEDNDFGFHLDYRYKANILRIQKILQKEG